MYVPGTLASSARKPAPGLLLRVAAEQRHRRPAPGDKMCRMRSWPTREDAALGAIMSTIFEAPAAISDSARWPLVAEQCALVVDRKSTRLNSSHVEISYAVFCLKKKKNITFPIMTVNRINSLLFLVLSFIAFVSSCLLHCYG